MRTAIQVDISYEQVLDLVKQLPEKDKIKLSRELEKEGIGKWLSRILSAFKNDEISMEMIDAECEIVRAELYAKRQL